MALVRWDPWRQLASMEIEQLNRMFDDLWGRVFEPGRWTPAVDIYENDNHDVVVAVELPGMKREDISITVEDNVLTVSGERTYRPEIRRDRFYRMERGQGEFSRSFTLPATLDTAKISAKYEDGLLVITLPQREEAKPRQIAVK